MRAESPPPPALRMPTLALLELTLKLVLQGQQLKNGFSIDFITQNVKSITVSGFHIFFFIILTFSFFLSFQAQGEDGAVLR